MSSVRKNFGDNEILIDIDQKIKLAMQQYSKLTERYVNFMDFTTKYVQLIKTSSTKSTSKLESTNHYTRNRDGSNDGALQYNLVGKGQNETLQQIQK